MKKLYEKAFGLRQPYQVLVDAEVCREALKSKVMVKEIVPEILGGPSKISNSCAARQGPLSL